MESHILTAAPAAPIITALVAAIGMAVPQLPRRAYPLVAIALGIAWCTIIAAANNDLGWPALIAGTIAGLTASGLYSAAVKPINQSLRGAQ